MRVGWKPQNYTARAASTRIRCLNILRELRSRRFPVELYRPRHSPRYGAVVFSKAYNPRDVELAESLRARGVRVAFDICDNHFLLEPERVTRLRRMFEIADEWIASSEVLASVVRTEMGDARPLTVIEDAVETRLRGPIYDLAGWADARLQLHLLDRFLTNGNNRNCGHLVWFGNHRASYEDSGLIHISKRRAEIEAAHRRHPVTLTVISDSREAFDSIFADWQIPVHYLPWSAHTFFSAMRRHDIAIIPIDVNAFTAVKTNNRIALSLWLGLGVVADAIDSYRIFDDCAFLDRWEEGLDRYLDDAALRATHVLAARQIIEQRFSVPVIASQWQALFERLLR